MLEGDLVGMIKERSVRSAMRLLSFERRGSRAQSKITEENGRFVLACTVTDKDGESFSLSVSLDSRRRAEAMKRKVAVTTIVSSVMVDAVAAQYGFEVRRVLTGFKYIGGVIAELEAAGEADRYLFGFEESYGYLSGTHVRDKDAVNASMLICQMAQYYRAKGMNLADAMRELYERHGYFLNKTLSFTFPGVEGGEKMKALMEGLRTAPPAEFAGCKVESVVDYATGVDGLPKANVIAFGLEGGNKVIIRPSGTEPKVKAYLFAKRPTRAEAEQLLADLEKAASDIMA